MPQRQLNVRSDEAAERATRLGRRLGKTTTEVGFEALRSYEAAILPRDERGLTHKQRRRFDPLMHLSARAQAHRLPDAPDAYLDEALRDLAIEPMDFDAANTREASRAFWLFGRGRHQARPTFGDCLSYAVAKVCDVPLLYKGDDFGQTDLRSAWRP